MAADASVPFNVESVKSAVTVSSGRLIVAVAIHSLIVEPPLILLVKSTSSLPTSCGTPVILTFEGVNPAQIPSVRFWLHCTTVGPARTLAPGAGVLATPAPEYKLGWMLLTVKVVPMRFATVPDRKNVSQFPPGISWLPVDTYSYAAHRAALTAVPILVVLCQLPGVVKSLPLLLIPLPRIATILVPATMNPSLLVGASLGHFNCIELALETSIMAFGVPILGSGLRAPNVPL